MLFEWKIVEKGDHLYIVCRDEYNCLYLSLSPKLSLTICPPTVSILSYPSFSHYLLSSCSISPTYLYPPLPTPPPLILSSPPPPPPHSLYVTYRFSPYLFHTSPSLFSIALHFIFIPINFSFLFSQPPLSSLCFPSL